MKSVFPKIILFSLAVCFIIIWTLSGDESRSRKVKKDVLAQSNIISTVSSESTTFAPQTTFAPETTDIPVTAETAVATETIEIAVTTEAAVTTETPTPKSGDIVLLFGGDVNLDEDYGNLGGTGSASACIDNALLSEMQSADLFMHGNIFALTDSTGSMQKAYVFKTAPENAALLSELGTDIVSLANNHSLDFGEEGLIDTISALDGQKIAYVGAGLDEERAKKPYYIEIGGKRIAFTAAMRSEKHQRTPEAVGENSGVVKMYDLENYLEIIREAAKNADYVVAYAHWGVENTIWLEQEQLDGARALIDAGADIVVGAHSYTLQTAEYYKGKPIFYGLGELSGEGGLAKITITENGDITAKIIPFNVADGVTSPLTGNALDVKIKELDYISASTVLADGSITE